MAWYNANGDPAPAAVRIEHNGKQVWLMNPAADAEWRKANGYVYDTKPIPPPPPPEPRTIYTKLQIRRAMRSLGIEEKLNALLYEVYREHFQDEVFQNGGKRKLRRTRKSLRGCSTNT